MSDVRSGYLYSTERFSYVGTTEHTNFAASLHWRIWTFVNKLLKLTTIAGQELDVFNKIVK